MIDDLPLSEQIRLELTWAEKLAAQTEALLAPFELAGVFANAGTAHARESAAGATGEFDPSRPSGVPPMERQFSEHPLLLPCATCGRPPRMYERTGDLTVVYFVECSPCGMRTGCSPLVGNAAHAWDIGDIQPIRHKSAAAA